MSIADKVWDELRRAGKGPQVVEIGLHPQTLAELERERDAHAPAWGVTLPPLDEIFGFKVGEDPFAPRGAVLIRERR